MNAAVTESVVEQAALAWLESLGYLILSGPEIAPDEAMAERENYGQIVLLQPTPDANYTLCAAHAYGWPGAPDAACWSTAVRRLGVFPESVSEMGEFARVALGETPWTQDGQPFLVPSSAVSSAAGVYCWQTGSGIGD